MTRALAVALALALLVSGCKRKPVPSPQYAEAEGLYSNLVSARGESAWLDPDMDRVYTLCNAVNEKSSDYAASRTMMAKIDSERARLKSTRSNFAPGNTRTAPPPEFLPEVKKNTPTAQAEADAGPEPEIAGFEVGSDFTQTLARYGPCFNATAVQVDTPHGKADGYVWAGRPDCPKTVQAVAGKVILVRGGKVVMVADKSRMVERVYETDLDSGTTRQVGGPPPEAPDAGAATAAPDAGPR